jgi:hypothetical protein
MKKQKRKISFGTKNRAALYHGFDLGSQLRVATVSDLSFIEQLNKAEICACAYGPVLPRELNAPVPAIHLVGQNEQALRSAFDAFARWGCGQDGDVVDLELAFWDDATYDMAITPELYRAQYRTMPHVSLYEPLFFGMSWIHHFDSIHPHLRDIASYVKRSMAPVLLSAAVLPQGAATFLPKKSQQGEILPLYGLPEVLKFNVRISSEQELTDVSVFWWLRERRRLKGKSIDSAQPAVVTPQRVSAARGKAIKIAFPVSKERISRSGLLNSVRKIEGFDAVTPVQVEQACINIQLSRELCQGEIHYPNLGAKFRETIWDHIFGRVELADGKNPFLAQSPSEVSHQLDLDARQVLKEHRHSVRGVAFPKLQKLLITRGFVDA